MHFGTGKSRDVLCRACRHHSDTVVTTSATRTSRVQGRRHSVDWGGHVHLTFSRSCSWDWCKTFTREHYCFFAVRHAGTSSARHARQAGHVCHDTSQRHVTTRCACHVVTCRDVTWRNKWNSGFWLQALNWLLSLLDTFVTYLLACSIFLKRECLPFFQQVAERSSANLMTPQNLAIVFGPNLLWSKNEASLTLIGFVQSCTVLLITRYDDLFVKWLVCHVPYAYAYGALLHMHMVPLHMHATIVAASVGIHLFPNSVGVILFPFFPYPSLPFLFLFQQFFSASRLFIVCICSKWQRGWYVVFWLLLRSTAAWFIG